jgi:transcriptional regulator with XRE-family HTH domain
MTKDTAAAAQAPHPIDRHVGARIRERRCEVGVTQVQLAEALGLTFQQVQKYERAANRVSASRLWEIATVLATDIAYFYVGLGEPPHPAADQSARQAASELLQTADGGELAGAFPRIRTGRIRRKLLELMRLLAAEDAAARDSAPA